MSFPGAGWTVRTINQGTWKINVFKAATTLAARSLGYEVHARPPDGSSSQRSSKPGSRLVALVQRCSHLEGDSPPRAMQPLRPPLLCSPPAAGRAAAASEALPGRAAAGLPGAAARSPWVGGEDGPGGPPPTSPAAALEQQRDESSR